MAVTTKLTVRALAVLAVALLLTGCGTGRSGGGYTGLSSVVLPGGAGTGPGSYIVAVDLDSAAQLVPNSEVKVDDVTVGAIRSIRRQGWHARLEIGLPGSVRLPANVTVKIGQKSLLGAEYLELVPPTDEPATGHLTGGSVIGIDRGGRYPETEEVLGALSGWLNGSGLRQVSTINSELTTALRGNEPRTRQLLGNLDTLTNTLDSQRTALVELLETVDQLGARLAARRGKLGTAIDRLAPGIAVLNRQRPELIDALRALDGFSRAGHRVITTSGDALRTNLRDLRPVLAGLDRSGHDLPNSLDIIGTLILPLHAAPAIVKGDYVNITGTLDVSGPANVHSGLPNTPIDRAVHIPNALIPPGNPLLGPFDSAMNGVAGSVIVGGSSGGLVTPGPSRRSPPGPPLRRRPPEVDSPGSLLGGG